jgi:hypothetical protein
MTRHHPRHVPSPALRVFLLGLAVSIILFCAGLLTMLGAHSS